jgi:hydrogenase maturation protein HypF
MAHNYVARKLEVNGIVQGVGFRPFVYNLARQHNLDGEVSNTSAGVIIHIEGPLSAVDAFTGQLTKSPPPLAHIVAVSSSDRPARGRTTGFSIVKSVGDEAMATLISPDVCVCNDCLNEMFDPRDRRHGYPFINCTNCGPRYTIIDDIPYDRPKTSMKHFQMCRQCQSEYDDPTDRRFHAQPNACPVCGPGISLHDNAHRLIETAHPVAETVKRLKEGFIVAVKGLGGFHLAVDAENSAAVKALRERKHREEKPLALMSADTDRIRTYAYITPQDEKLLTSIQRPIVLLKQKNDCTIAPEVAPHNRYFGVMLPYTPLHYLILEKGFTALVMTSGNLSEEPIAIDNADAFDRLADIADYFLIHNRDIYLRSDDSIVRYASGNTRFIRRSRGYVPVPIFLKKTLPPVLACGAELKSTICMTKNNMAFLSQHLGDLENVATYDFFQLTIRHMKRILEFDPEIIAYDMHPDYLSTRWALEQTGVEKVPVQHHHAHIVGAMAENHIDEPVIGLSFDGTGYGTDHTIWGGEVLVAEKSSFSRVAHFDYVPMPGGTAAIRQPWRMAVSYLHNAFGEQLWDLKLPLFRAIDQDRLAFILQMVDKGVNSPVTSSLGRLFDGVAAIVGLRNEVVYEGQAAMEFEMTAGEGDAAPYDYDWQAGDEIKIMTAPIIRGVAGDAASGKDISEISARFHRTLILLFADLCDKVRDQTSIDRVVMSGGVFQNATLLEGLLSALEEKGLKVYTHSLVPTNDGGICLGQAVIAAAKTAGL